ncbi:unnamed protein product [Phytomonas sp. EM1]|nr:unnamed protein product [Phytomonas sp. EM1]|eukprot:CCW62141.1 unnamed protein product [Phytomonas sp. isolate EM1]
MLGSQSWIAAVGIPTFVITGFIASRKRLAHQWREELMDPVSDSYPPLSDEHMEFLRGVAFDLPVIQAEGTVKPRQVDGALGTPLTKKENIGLRVEKGFLAPHEVNIFLNQVCQWSVKLGCTLDPLKVRFFEQKLEQGRLSELRVDHQVLDSDDSSSKTGLKGCLRSSWSWLRRKGSGRVGKGPFGELDSSFFSQVRVISDHPESNQPVKAPWGSGDRMRFDLMPASLRNLVHRVQQSCPGIGRLRHVYIEYSPKGSFYHEPSTPKYFDGNDYVIIPLRRDSAQMVITFSPVMRSRFSSLREIMQNSWTNRDIDCLLPNGGLLRVYGLARYDWGWSVRPGAGWFGSHLNPITPTPSTRPSSSQGVISTWFDRLQQVVGLLAPENASLTYPMGGIKGVGGIQPSQSDAALVVLHFEGPRSKKKQRSMLLEPELLIFGRVPTADKFETWTDDQPTKEGVHKVGVLRFMVGHYLDLLMSG